ncbi:hypothetical protein [Palleronia abyssalis]|uniref:Uncharacterized protein n=1 Tax=Palleronia abyssalis TaxID=1501240 RepID=A0A2R8BU38_9RHOB|nr:hypothetical protein [Palleronia abyssalis]SPJ23643.1 hypothetical protein PAA8504_01456 [Palleronia abyssalis]
MKPLSLALLLALATGPAFAQDPLAAARSTYQSFLGTWAEPGKNCDRPIDTWNFGPEAVVAGTTALDILGIGGGAGAIRVDLVSRATGERLPLSMQDTGGGIEVSGSGIYANLRPCNAAFTPERQRQDDVITSQPLDQEGPSTDELRDALGEPEPVISSPDPVLAPEPDPSLDPAEQAEQMFETRFAGFYQGPSGACDWELSGNRITGGGTSYDVVNFSGEGERIGVQALAADGAPTTFTVRPEGPGTRVSGAIAGSGDQIDVTLNPC